jgi:hypothetical protein
MAGASHNVKILVLLRALVAFALLSKSYRSSEITNCPTNIERGEYLSKKRG